MTEQQTSAIVEAFNTWLDESGSALRFTYPDAEKVAEAIEHVDASD
jgi:hypothetical protein